MVAPGEWWRRWAVRACPAVLGAVWLSGCGPSEEEKFRSLSKQINALKIEKIELEDRLAKRDATIEGLEAQLARLRDTGQAPPAPLFEIDHIEILSISSGIDTDGQPGDDAAVVYFRPVDRDGDVLKLGGEIDVRLIDFHAQEGPRQVGELRIGDPQEIRKSWYGKFWTNHYKVVVPFAAGADLKPGQELDIVVAFVESATGRLFRDRKVVIVHPG